MNTFYSNGKLLITAEYLVLEGAKALALPTKFGQDLVVESIKEPQLIWESFDVQNNCWFEAVFDLPKLRLVNATFNSDNEGSSEMIAETLQTMLEEARKLNPEFLQSSTGFVVKTNLTFPRDWGLGSSSTLLNNIAQWAEVDAYQLLWNSFSGSGYDIACAQSNSPVFYQLENKFPKVEIVEFNPEFKDQLFFVHLNQKQDSREGIERFKKKRENINDELDIISEISNQIIHSKNLFDFEKLLEQHEDIISKIVELPKVKDLLFSDYFGAVKSLGAWGGDFVLATGNEKTPNYFKSKGFETVIPYADMIL